jgi:hypothetical protein
MKKSNWNLGQFPMKISIGISIGFFCKGESWNSELRALYKQPIRSNNIDVTDTYCINEWHHWILQNLK